MPTRITAANIAPGAITADRLAEGAGGGPRITNVQVTDDTYTVIDDTAVALSGGYVKITGTGFQSGCVAIVGITTATATAFVSSNFINVQVPALSAGTYIVYVVNPDGGVAIRVNGLTYSATPTWITGSTLSEIGLDDQISIQLSASSNSTVTYDLQAGSTLPPGLSLSAQGLLSGAVTDLEDDTVYSFTVIAQDAENQDSPRTFSVTVVIGDPYFYLTTLLLNGDGTNAANNNTFLDSSTNNFTVTRSGNTTQGSFSPFSQDDGKWGAYFDGSGDYLTTSSSPMSYAGNFCIELWFYTATTTVYASLYSDEGGSTGGTILLNNASANGQITFYMGPIANFASTSTGLNNNAWHHVAVTRSESTVRLFIDGNLENTTTASGTITTSSTFRIGSSYFANRDFAGYISNFRTVVGSAVYTSAFTPSTAPLTAISGTSLLTCQSNRFKDNSANNFVITRNGDVSVQPMSPFAPAGKYLPAVNGGSGYFDGVGDFLSLPASSQFALGTQDFCFECWYYPVSKVDAFPRIAQSGLASWGTSDNWALLDRHNDASTKFGWACVNLGGNGILLQSTTIVQNHQWYHIAITRSGSTFRMFVNGVQESTYTNSGSCTTSATVGFYIGSGSAADSDGNGYISSARYVVGSSVYTSNFSVLTTPLTAISGTSLLLNFTNSGIIDATGRNNIETVNAAQISTAEKKYGTGSILLTPGGGSVYTRAPLTEQLKFGTGDFTIECWIYLITNVAGICAVWSNYSSFSAGSLSLFAGHNSSNANLFHIAHNGGFPALSSSTTVNSRLNTWTHLAVVRYNGQIKLYINGVSEGTPFASTVALNGVGSYFWVGSTGDSTTANPNCYLDDFRVTKGYARYTTNFTPPDSAHRLR